LQKNAAGALLVLTEDLWDRKTRPYNLVTRLPKLEAALKTLPGPFILDGEFMALDEAGEAVPRRDLASYRSGKDQGLVRIRIFDALYLPETGNIVARPLIERKRLLSSFLEKQQVQELELTRYRVTHNREEALKAIDWARKIPGSEGAMLKLLQGTVTLNETDSQAKLKLIRELVGIVYDKHPVKDSPGVFNYVYGIGPVSVEEAKAWPGSIELNGAWYVPAGRTFNSKVEAALGDHLRIEVTELLLDESQPVALHFRGFTPTVIEVTSEPVTSVAEVKSKLFPSEIKRTVQEVRKAAAEHLAYSDKDVLPLEDRKEEHYIMGVVLVPDEEDTWGEIYDEEAVRLAAHWFMEYAAKLGLMHVKGVNGARMRILESWVTPVDFTYNGNYVKKGSWLLAARVLDPKLWEACKDGRFAGWSIDGDANWAYLDS
jgi:hypothetical protein